MNKQDQYIQSVLEQLKKLHSEVKVNRGKDNFTFFIMVQVKGDDKKNLSDYELEEQVIIPRTIIEECVKSNTIPEELIKFL